jgi:hypothetical protein
LLGFKTSVSWDFYIHNALHKYINLHSGAKKDSTKKRG